MKWFNLSENPIEEEGLYLLTYEHKTNIIFITNHGSKFIKKEFWFFDYPQSDTFEPWHHLCVEVAEKDKVFYMKIPLNEYHRSCIEYEERSISNEIRLHIYRRDSYKCVHCETSPAIDNSVELCIDHIHPISLGGTNHTNNLQTLCRSCNSQKSNKWIFNNERN